MLPTSLSLPDRVEELIVVLTAFKPDIVAPDTLNAFFGPGDENSTQDMTRFVSALRRLREALACSVILLHHTPNADTGRERGSSALRGAADVVIQVGKDQAGSGCVGFQVVIGRDIEPMEQPVALRLHRIDTDWVDDDGEPISTCLVERATAQPVTLPGRATRPLGEAQIAILAVARAMAATTQPDETGWVTLARADVAARAKEERNVNRKSISSAWQPLQDRGYLKLVEPGSVRLRVCQ